MSGACKLLRASLELYAEGELGDGRELGRLRRHLALCAPCREFLARHDELTRRLLEEGAGEARLPWEEDPDEPRAFGTGEPSERAERIWERIEELPGAERGIRPERRAPPSTVRVALAAAALVLIALHLSGVLRKPATRGPEVEVVTELEREHGFAKRSGRAEPRRTPFHLGGLRWVRDPALASSFRSEPAVRGGDRWMWLFAAAPDDGSTVARAPRGRNATLALAVERVRGPGEAERLLLVPEEVLLASVRGRGGEGEDTALEPVLEVTPRELLEVALMSLRRDDAPYGRLARRREAAAGYRRYRVLAVGGLDSRHATVLEAPASGIAGWDLGGAGTDEPDPLGGWRPELLIDRGLEGPRS